MTQHQNGSAMIKPLVLTEQELLDLFTRTGLGWLAEEAIEVSRRCGVFTRGALMVCNRKDAPDVFLVERI